jgi:hypothetical protein
MKPRKHCFGLSKDLRIAVLAAPFLLLGSAPIAAQEGVSLENASIVVTSNINVILDVDGNDVVIGRADAANNPGFPFDEDVDLEIIDAFNTLSDLETSFNFNASAADFNLGSGSIPAPGQDGDLNIEDGLGRILIDIEGSTGDIFQDIDNTGTILDFDGNGAVKGWAIVAVDGSIKRCWRCVNGVGTGKLATGQYEVDFQLGSINNRPMLATIGTGDASCFSAQCNSSDRIIEVQPRFNDASSVWVETSNLSGTPADTAFIVLIF